MARSYQWIRKQVSTPSVPEGFEILAENGPFPHPLTLERFIISFQAIGAEPVTTANAQATYTHFIEVTYGDEVTPPPFPETNLTNIDDRDILHFGTTRPGMAMLDTAINLVKWPDRGTLEIDTQTRRTAPAGTTMLPWFVWLAPDLSAIHDRRWFGTVSSLQSLPDPLPPP